MKWRVIPLRANNAYMNMGIDEAVGEAVARGESPPTMRFYEWQPRAVSIGRFQSLLDEVDLENCRKKGVDYVRRLTGGGAVYHDSEITYSVIAREDLAPKDITKSYQLICGWIVRGLAELGIQAEFKPVNDIVVAGKKISGSAQTRREGVVLQHGTVLYDLDLRTMFTVLKVGADKISDKLIKSAEERVTRVLNYANVSEEELYEALLKGFTADKEWEYGSLSPSELSRAEELAETRYAAAEWNHSR